MTDIYVTKPYLPPREEYNELLNQLWDSHYLTNMGPMHNRLEEKLADFLKVPYMLAFNNGHAALEAILRVNHISGEVITTPFTFASTTHAITRCGATPVFADIRMEDYTIDPDKIEALITEKTTAILPVHVYGNVCQVDRIEEIARKYGLKVIYDAAHAFGVTYKGNGIGSYGDAVFFSFHATKLFHCVEGGGIAVKDWNMCLEYHKERNYGIIGEGMIVQNGGNGKMSEFHAAMGLCNLGHIQDILTERRRVAESYRSRLSDVKGLIIHKSQKDVEENYAYFPIVLDEKEFGETRDSLYERLEKNGIHTRKYFYPLTSDFVCYREQYGQENLPVAKYVSDRVLTLPLYDSLSDRDIDRICDVILYR